MKQRIGIRISLHKMSLVKSLQHLYPLYKILLGLLKFLILFNYMPVSAQCCTCNSHRSTTIYNIYIKSSTLRKKNQKWLTLHKDKLFQLNYLFSHLNLLSTKDNL